MTPLTALAPHASQIIEVTEAAGVFVKKLYRHTTAEVSCVVTAEELFVLEEPPSKGKGAASTLPPGVTNVHHSPHWVGSVASATEVVESLPQGVQT
jgi:uncharacterized protein YycO